MKLASRRDILKFSAACTAISAINAGPLWAQPAAWPTKPVSLLVGYPPGGLTDAGARFVSKNLPSAWGQTVVVDNKPGASGNIAAAEVQRTMDGSKLLVANTSFTINPHTLPTPSPDPRAFTPIGLILESQLVLCVNPNVPAKNLTEFMAWVKSEHTKGGFSYANAGNGGNTHLAMEYFREQTGLPQMVTVPYKGSAPAIQDVIGNQVPCLMDAASLLIPFINTGKLRPILVTGSRRLPALPDVPTATELGIKDFVVTVFVGMWGPPNMPADMVKTANAGLNVALADPAVVASITKNGDSVGGGTAERLATLTQSNYNLWGEVARRNSIRAS